MTDFSYLAGYAPALQQEVKTHLESGALQERLRKQYPALSSITNDRQLRVFVIDLKNRHLKRSKPISKIIFDDKMRELHGALGLHSFVSRVQGSRTKAKNEVRIASLFKTLPQEFLKMVVVHELAHLKEKNHDKAFYKLCCLMDPDYHQLEFDLRLYMTAQSYDKRDV